MFAPDECIAACATATDGAEALIRVSGPQAQTYCSAAGLSLPASWQWRAQHWHIGKARLPCRVLLAAAPHSFSGYDCVEIVLPGADVVVEHCLQHLHDCGVRAASAGAFTRQALANGRLHLDQAEAILALTHAGDAEAAADALNRLRGALSDEIEDIRQQIIQLRAQVEVGLDFMEEDDVSSYDATELQRTLRQLRQDIARWQRAAVSIGTQPQVCLVGRANAGKSALFNALSDSKALISDEAGTTRDMLHADMDCHGRRITLIDTAGWLDQARSAIDSDAISAGRQALQQAQLLIACSAPDAPLPEDLNELPPHHICATKADLGHNDPRAVLCVSAFDGTGIEALKEFVAEQLGLSSSGEPRQQRCLAAAAELLDTISNKVPDDVLLSDDLRQIADHLGDLIGLTTTDDIMDVIFSRFCIGK